MPLPAAVAAATGGVPARRGHLRAGARAAPPDGAAAIRLGPAARGRCEIAATRSFLVDVHLLKTDSRRSRRAATSARGPYRLPGAGRDGVLRRRDGGARAGALIRRGGASVPAWATGGAVRLRAEAAIAEAAAPALERMRFALGVDHDLRAFHRRFSATRCSGRSSAAALAAAAAAPGAVRGARLGDHRAADRVGRAAAIQRG